jgi:2-oxoglutarate dehydrogenase E1 component
MWHTHNNRFTAGVDSYIDNGFRAWNHRFNALQAESLLTTPLLLQESLKLFGLKNSFVVDDSVLVGDQPVLKLETIIERLKDAYCDSIAVEYMHIGSKEQCDFIRDRIENPEYRKLTNEDRIINYKRVLQAEKFETFLQKKWSSEKRFGLEGVESMIPCTKAVIDVAVDAGCESIIMGMPHRGRLNVLANIVRKDFSTLFTQFNSELETDDVEMTGDVKYHLGIHHERLNYKTNKMVTLACCANPSHLEAVDPVVQGKTRAEQYYREDHV